MPTRVPNNRCLWTETNRGVAQRHGMTLAEVTIAVAISSILLGIAVTMLVRLQAWDARFRDDAITTQQVAQLAELIRRDIRAATNVALASPRVLTVNVHDERDIHYELTPLGCLRIVEHPVGKEEQRELFRVGPDLIWRVESSQSGVRPNVTVTLEQPSDEPTTSNTVRLVASANRGADLPPNELMNSTN